MLFWLTNDCKHKNYFNPIRARGAICPPFNYLGFCIIMNNICNFMFWSLQNYIPVFIIRSLFILPVVHFQNPHSKFSHNKILPAHNFQKKIVIFKCQLWAQFNSSKLIFCIQCQNIYFHYRIFFKYFFYAPGRNWQGGGVIWPPLPSI